MLGNKNIQSCRKCENKEKPIKIQHSKIENHHNRYAESYAKYEKCIGNIYGDYKLTAISSKVDIPEESTWNIQGFIGTVECVHCGRENKVNLKNLVSENFRRVPKCECKASNEEYYRSFVGMSVFGDTVVDFKYCKEGRKFNRSYVLRCNECGVEREIENVSAIPKNVQLESPPDNFGYKRCNCIKSTKDKDRLARYRKYINTVIDGTQLKILDIYEDEDRKLKTKVECSCGTIKNGMILPAILNGHSRTCGCGISNYIWNNSRYTSEEFIGRKFDDLEVMEITQSPDRKILWRCKCLVCGEEEYINPKLVVERHWHIGCGCKKQKAVERNQVYTDESLVGTECNAGTILEIIKTPSGTTNWKVKCQYCGTDFIAIAANVAIGHTRSCGCLGRSLGEKLVEEVLKELGLNYFKQVSPNGLTSVRGGKVYFDFALEYNEKVLAIEYDGEQHYDERYHNFSRYMEENHEGFLRLQANDKIKEEHCKRTGAYLLRLRDRDYHGNKEKIKEKIKQVLSTF